MAGTTVQKGPARKGMAVPLTAFAAGAVVALLVGVFGRLHDPSQTGTTTLGFDSVIAMKVTLTAVIGVLAVAQLVGALWLYGRLGRPAPPWVGTAHRVVGAVTLLLTVLVAYNCLWALGLQAGYFAGGGAIPTRIVVHGLL